MKDKLERILEKIAAREIRIEYLGHSNDIRYVQISPEEQKQVKACLEDLREAKQNKVSGIKHSGQVNISRVQSNMRDEDYIELSLVDKAAGTTFVSAEISLNHFAEALTGLGFRPCEFTVRGLKNVGLKVERDVIHFVLPSVWSVQAGDIKKVARQEAEEQCPEGWQVNDRFASQNSFYDKDDEVWARCNIIRWVKKKEE